MNSIRPLLRLLRPAFGLFAAAALAADDGWETLFDGRTLAGWKAAEHPGSITVQDGLIACNGPRAHLFYLGADGKAEFENFELELEVKAMSGANSGVYFHATWQDEGWPRLSGTEVQVNNDQPPFDQGYWENKKTGSLYGYRNLYKAMVRDNEWFTMNIVVRKPRVQVRLNGRLMIDYVEPTNVPVLVAGATRDQLTHGTFALQCHDEKSQVYYRNIRVRRLPPGTDAAVARPTYNEQDLRRQVLGRDNFPLVNLRTHVEGGPTLAELREIESRTGLFAGRVYRLGNRNEIADETAARSVLEKMNGEPIFVGLEIGVPGGAQGLLTPATLARFDYVAGRYAIAAWGGDRFLDPHRSADEQLRAFEQTNMDQLVQDRVKAMAEDPVDVLADPLQLPDGVSARADELWTEARMQQIIAAAVKHGVALEISPRDRNPPEKFIALAKAAGAKFTVGDDGANAAQYADWSYLLEIQKKLNLSWKDMWVPGHRPSRAQRALLKN